MGSRCAERRSRRPRVDSLTNLAGDHRGDELDRFGEKLPGERERSIVFVLDSEATSRSVQAATLIRTPNRRIGRFHRPEMFVRVRSGDFIRSIALTRAMRLRCSSLLPEIQRVQLTLCGLSARQWAGVSNPTMSLCPFSNNSAI